MADQNFYRIIYLVICFVLSRYNNWELNVLDEGNICLVLPDDLLVVRTVLGVPDMEYASGCLGAFDRFRLK